MTDLLFHYTSPESLIGILTSRCIWATDIKYLNDSAELEYALTFTKSKVSQKYMTDDYDSHVSYLLSSGFAKLDPMPIYVASLSEMADLLSQWRAYCPPTGGVAIAFDRRKIDEYADRHRLELTQCTYDTSEHNELLTKLYEKVYKAFSHNEMSVDAYNLLSPKQQVDFEIKCLKDLTEDGDILKEEVKETLSGFFRELLALAPRIKHPSFSEEREWRLICRDYTASGFRIAFRTRQSLIIPYVEIGPLEPEAIFGVVIGPCSHGELLEQSVARLTQNLLGRKVDIIHSTTPYRNL